MPKTKVTVPPTKKASPKRATKKPIEFRPVVETMLALDLVPDQANVRVRDDRAKSTIAASLRQFGPARSIVRSNGVVRAGNGTLEAFVAAGGTEALVVRPEPGQLVVVDRDDWSPSEAVGYSIADNRAAELASWDDGGLASTLESIRSSGDVELEAIGFDDGEIDALIKRIGDEVLADSAADPGPAAARAAELQKKWKTKRDQLWEIGRHRLLCGDSTNADDVTRIMDGTKADMMFTDPPYGVGYEGGHFHSGNVNIKRKREAIASDGDSGIYDRFIPLATEAVDGPCYVWFAGSQALAVYQAVENAKCEIHAMIVWHKTNATYAAMNAQYKQRHEPLLYFKPKNSTLRWCGPNDECTIWEIPRDSSNEFHPTQKPVALAARAIGNHKAVVIADFFAGSGSTIVAAEQTGRSCRAIEIEPKYVAVILERLAGMGLEPRLVN